MAPGLYLYVGSALNGVEQRVARHLSAGKRRHWHIDYLLGAGWVRQVWVMPCREKVECVVASRLAEKFEAVSGFGSSDCRCRSHLFRVADVTHPALTPSSA
ncbi:MAG: GIY-YIG nuclease family protein [Chloroflexi bacterium]|nr:GIY-YIG nuclease family protein [Chloroflexota bacterium]